MIITVCGHKELSDAEQVRAWLEEVLERLIRVEEITFYLGGYGGFDRMAAAVLWEKKQLHPNVQLVLILAYLNRRCNAEHYDGVVYPPLETVPPRYAIAKRNEWMIEQADLVIAYVTHGWGGAARTLEYAKRKKKKIICYPALE